MNDPYETVSEDDEDGEHEGDAVVRAFVNPPVEDSPVVPLGYYEGKVVFALEEGEIRHEEARFIARMLKTDIFVSVAGAGFLNYWRDPDGDKFRAEAAAIWFNRKCRAAGRWDTRRAIRSLGVWPGDGREVILHKGDELWRFTGGEYVRQSIIEALRAPRGPLYRLCPPAPEPQSPSSSAEGHWVIGRLAKWNYGVIGNGEGASGADVAAGLFMASLLAAYGPFRGHLLIDAMAGSGKTELMLFLQSLAWAMGVEVIDNFTEAGLRSDLSGEARTVLLDEAESSAEPGQGAVEKVIRLMRGMATGKGSGRVQGTAAGGSLTQTAVGSVIMAGINPPKLNPQDASRIVQVRLLPLTGKLADQASLEAMRAEAQKLSPKLLGRALAGAARYREDFASIKLALTGEGGETPRGADLIAMLAAGRRLLLNDHPLTPEEAVEEVVFWRPLIDERAASGGVTNEGSDALAHLFAWSSGQHRHDRVLSIGELVDQVVKGGDYEGVLGAHGLKVLTGSPCPGAPDANWLCVANNHPVLERIFERTKWKDWKRTFTYLDALGEGYQTHLTKSSLRFGPGMKQRALAIPLAPWIEGQTSSRNASVPPTVPEEDIDFDS